MPQQFGCFDFQRRRKPRDGLQTGVAHTALQVADIAALHSGLECKLLLREASLPPEVSHIPPKGRQQVHGRSWRMPMGGGCPLIVSFLTMYPGGVPVALNELRKLCRLSHRVWWGGSIVCLLVAAGGSAAAAVWPREAAPLKPIELSALISQFLTAPNLRWEMLQNGSVRWTTNGIETNERRSFRRGLARVKLNGRSSTILRQNIDELAWSIELSTFDQERFGPTLATINPGTSQEQCFGTGFTGCYFTAEEALGRLGLRQACSVGPAGNVAKVYERAGRRSMTVVYRNSTGSGGRSASIELDLREPSTICAEERSNYPYND
jgi:hypothetical protein